MMARGFKPVGWVAAVGSAALGCYMLSLNVAAERAELASLERRIVGARQDIRSLQTELGTRGRLSQLEEWNAQVLALSAPNSAQYLENEVMLARFDQRGKTFEEKAKVQLAATETPAKAAPKVVFAAAERPQPASVGALVQRAALVSVADDKPLVRRASITVDAPAPRQERKPAARPAGSTLFGDKLLTEIGAAARSERARDGAAGN